MLHILPVLLKHSVEQTQLAWKEYEGNYKSQFHYKKMNGLVMNKQGHVLFGRPGARNPGEQLQMDTLQLDFSKAYIRLGYSLATLVPIEVWKADEAGVLMKVIPTKAGALARSHYILREYLAAEYIENIVFATEGNNTPTTSDGRPLLSTAHPRSKADTATTWSNKLSTDASLSVASAQAASTMMLRQKDPRGYGIIRDQAMSLCASTDLKYVAKEILKTEWVPYSLERTKNFLNEDNLELKLNPYWTAQSAAGLAAGVYDSWFFQGSDHTMTFYYGEEEPEVENDYLLQVRSLLYVATTSSAVGADSPYHIAGSPGAG